MYKKLKKMAVSLTCAFTLAVGAQSSFAQEPLEPGTKMPDGSIYVDISPDTNKPMYAYPGDLYNPLDLSRATVECSNLGFRVPSKAELNVLYLNSEKGDLKGTFDKTGPDGKHWSNGWYWSSTLYKGWIGSPVAYFQHFKNGKQGVEDAVMPLSIRCVR